MSNIGYATLSVIPSARGFGSSLSREVDPQMRAPGLSAGKVLGAGLVAGVAIAAAGIAAVLKTGIGEAMDASAGTAQLTAGIASTGNAANVTVGGLNSLASSIQAYSGQTDDSIVASEQLLLTFTNIRNTDTDKIFDRATAATADMAAKMGGDAAGSAIQLGKALNDPIAGMASLGRMGVQFTDGQKETIRSLIEQGDVVGAQNVILGELETQFGGAAAAAGQSLPGQLEIAKRSFEDVSQSVAEGLLPVVLPGLTSIGSTIATKVIPAVSGFIQGFKDGEGAGGTFRDVLTTIYERGIKPVADFITGTALPAVQGFIAEFRNGEGAGGTLRDILTTVYEQGLVPLAGFITGTAIPAISSFIGWIRQNADWLMGIVVAVGAMILAFQLYQGVLAVIRGVTVAYTAVQWLLNVAMSANPIGLIILAIVGLVAGFVWLWNNVEGFRNFWIGAWNIIKTAAVAVWDWIKNAATTTWDALKSAWEGASSFFGGIGDSIRNAFKSAFNWVASGWNDTIGALSWTIPDWVPGIGGNTISVPNIPLLASGALVTGPTLAMIGEGNEPEAVLPLSKLDALLKSNANGRPGMTVNQYITTSDPEAAGIAGLRRIQALGA